MASRQQQLTIHVESDLAIVTDVLPDAVTGQNYDEPLLASGGVPPYGWTLVAGQLPPGMVLQASGWIQGIPTAAGDYTFTVQLDDSE